MDVGVFVNSFSDAPHLESHVGIVTGTDLVPLPQVSLRSQSTVEPNSGREKGLGDSPNTTPTDPA